MEIWLIEDGKKAGPYLDFEIRSRIHAGELTEERKIWHLDLDGWTPLGEVGLFANEFKKAEELKTVTSQNLDEYTAALDKELDESPQKADDTPPPIPESLHLWRRFAARWFDFILYGLLLTAVLVMSGRDVFTLGTSTAFAFISVLPWLFLESLSTSIWGTTPGKWLVGLKVRDAKGQKLSAGAAILRTMRVIILGMGFGQGILIFICHGIAAWLGFKRKIVLWDTPVGTKVLLANPKPLKWVLFGSSLFVIFILNVILMLPFMSEMPTDHLTAQQQEQWDKLFPPKDGDDAALEE